MDIAKFNSNFNTDKVFQTKVLASLAEEVKKSGAPGKFSINAGATGGISEVLVGKDSDDIGSQLLAANAAITTLSKFGVNDLDKLAVFDPNIDPLALNVVYKNGGWVVNS